MTNTLTETPHNEQGCDLYELYTQDERDLILLTETVDALYPDCRKFHKRLQAELTGAPGKSLAPPQHRAFETLLAFAGRMQQDPALFARLRDESLPQWKAQAAQQKAQKTALEGVPPKGASLSSSCRAGGIAI